MKFYRRKKKFERICKNKKKQNPEAQIEKEIKCEQTTTKKSKQKFHRRKQIVQYHRQYSCLTYIYSMYFCFVKFAKDLSFDNGREEEKQNK
jgi:hypothetical protein